MDWDVGRIQAQMNRVQPVSEPQRTQRQDSSSKSGIDFEESLRRAAEKTPRPEVTISAHASQRLLQRGISLDAADLEKISNGLDRAEEKGAKESLFVLRDLALVVSVENRTVITALHGEGAKDNVFTNIDSAVIL